MNPSDPTPTANQIPPQIAVVQMASSYWLSQCIYVAAKLGIADLLKGGSQHCNELAVATGTHSDSLYRLLRALASAGIFAETESRCFELTPLAACLQKDVPGSVRAFILMLGEEHYQAWGNLLHSVQTGNSAFEQLYGMNLFEYYQQNPVSGHIFNEAMTSSSAIEQEAIVAAYDFSSIGKLVDIGGGQGSLMAAILQKNPNLKGVVFDQPHVVEKAANVLEAARVMERCELVGGDFFDKVAAGGDAYMLKHIIHDWDDERAIAILRCCHEAMVEDGRLLVIEPVIPTGNEPFSGKFLDINMLVMSPGGRERTEAEYRELFQAAGFKLMNIVPTQSDISVIEGIRVNNAPANP